MTRQYIERQLRYFERKAAELRLTSDASDTKEKTEKVSKEKEEEKTTTPTARVRARVSGDFLKRWKIPSLFADYWYEATEKLDITDPADAEQSVRNYWAFAEKDKVWHVYKRNHAAAIARAARAFTPDDWQICAERCANFSCGKCLRGLAIPPVESEHPHPPEECPRFHPKSQSV